MVANQLPAATGWTGQPTGTGLSTHSACVADRTVSELWLCAVGRMSLVRKEVDPIAPCERALQLLTGGPTGFVTGTWRIVLCHPEREVVDLPTLPDQVVMGDDFRDEALFGH